MCPKTEARLIKLGTLQARIRAYNEAKATCDKDDVRVTIPRDQLLGDFEDLLEAVEQLAHELRCSNETIDMLYEKSRRYVEQLADLWKQRERECDEARAEIERLNRRLESEQHFIDAVCHYRNLAIVLGAKPEQMLGKFDRELCESGIDPDETSSGYHVSVNQELDTLKDVWAEVERLQAMLKDAILERDEALADLSTSRRANGRIIKERDEARAYKDQWQRAAEEERAKVRAEFEEWKRDHLNHEADDLRAERDEARAEVERLREAARQIRWGLIDMRLSAGLDHIDQKRRELFEITNGMVK